MKFPVRPATLALLALLAADLTLAQAAAPAPRGAASGLRGAVNAAGSALGNAAPAGNTAGAALQSANNTTANLQSNNSNSLESNTLLAIINKAFDSDSGDMIDPENGTMKWKGHTYELGQMRIFRARFERYLSLAPNADQREYQALIDKLFKALATNNPFAGKDDNMKEAWQILFQAAEYEADAGTALDVANQVFNTWRTRDEKESQRIAGIELERVRTRQQADVARGVNVIARETNGKADDVSSNAMGLATEALTSPSALMQNLPNPAPTISTDNSTVTGVNVTNGTAGTASSPSNNNSNSNRNGGDNRPGGNGRVGGRTGTTTPTTVQAGDQTLNTRHLLETEARLVANRTSQMLTVAAAKLQFQGTIVSLFLQRKFQHAIIASSFYRHIFKGSAQDLDPKFSKTVSEFVPAAGDVPFSIGMIEQLSREALDEVRRGMAAVRSDYADGRLMAALQRLQESFFLGEFLGEVSMLEKDKRQKLYDLYSRIDQARKLADLKDYDGIVKLTDEIGGLTKDFRAKEVTAAAGQAMRLSNLALASAKQATAMGDYDRAQPLLEKAAAIWPLNPDIAAFGSGVSAGASITTQAALMFDDAYKHGEYRRIFDRRAELTVGLLNDEARAPQFKDVIERMSRVEMALAQSQEAINQNNAFAAWDAVAAAAELAPNDNAVNQRKAELAPRVADYVGAADKARAAEQRGETAASLSYWLVVQDINPASPLARVGIERVSAKLLTELATEAKAASLTVNAKSSIPAAPKPADADAPAAK
jgi:hypothetical protein